MIWIAVIAFIISFFVFVYYHNKSETEGYDDISFEGFLFGFYGSLIVLFISGMYIFYSILNTHIGLALVALAFILFIYFSFRIIKK